MEATARPLKKVKAPVTEEPIQNAAGDTAGDAAGLHDAAGVDTVNAEHVEAAICSKQIGDRVRRLRTRRGLGLVELGEKTGLSASFLSQIETGRVVPTVRNLARIALAFGKDLSYFFRDEQPVRFRIMRRGERVRLQSNPNAGPNFVSENLSAVVCDQSIIPCIAEFEVSPQPSNFTPRVFKGVEFTFVMEGELNLNSETQSARLGTGDVAWVDGSRKRCYTCPPGMRTRAVIITRHEKH